MDLRSPSGATDFTSFAARGEINPPHYSFNFIHHIVEKSLRLIACFMHLNRVSYVSCVLGRYLEPFNGHSAHPLLDPPLVAFASDAS